MSEEEMEYCGGNCGYIALSIFGAVLSTGAFVASFFTDDIDFVRKLKNKFGITETHMWIGRASLGLCAVIFIVNAVSLCKTGSGIFGNAFDRSSIPRHSSSQQIIEGGTNIT